VHARTDKTQRRTARELLASPDNARDRALMIVLLAAPAQSMATVVRPKPVE
jgi:hypothetical protein